MNAKNQINILRNIFEDIKTNPDSAEEILRSVKITLSDLDILVKELGPTKTFDFNTALGLARGIHAQELSLDIPLGWMEEYDNDDIQKFAAVLIMKIPDRELVKKIDVLKKWQKDSKNNSVQWLVTMLLHEAESEATT